MASPERLILFAALFARSSSLGAAVKGPPFDSQPCRSICSGTDASVVLHWQIRRAVNLIDTKSLMDMARDAYTTLSKVEHSLTFPRRYSD
jgi:hypothetical protein